MNTLTDVLKVLLTMSATTLNPHRRILLSDLQAEISMPVEILVLRLCELQQRGLVNIHETNSISVNVTKRGLSEITNANEEIW